jgi:tRNA1Val (adenine37-N6)-methyltransferase
MRRNLPSRRKKPPATRAGAEDGAAEERRMQTRLDETGFGHVRILQDPAGFCYGVDAVMLAAFAAEHCVHRGKQPKRLCDLGTGNGIIPMLLSELTEIGEMVGIDVLDQNIDLARRSTELNGLEERLRFITGTVCDLQQGAPFTKKIGGEHSFDVIVSNPPYTPANSGLKSSADARMIARHEVLGSLEDFLRGASVLLDDRGDLFLVHRPSRMVDVLTTCRRFGLEPKTLQLVSGKQGESPNLMLLHCVRNGGRELRILPQQYAREQDGTFSEWMGNNYKCI